VVAISQVQNFTGISEISSRRVEGNPQTLINPLEGTKPKQFSELVQEFAADVNNLQFKAGAAVDMMVSGEAIDVHQVMVAVEQAGVALDLMLEIRNKTLEGYQELIRMQV